MAIGILTCNILQLLDNILPASQYQRDDKNTFLYILTINYAASCFPDSIANVLHFYPCLVLREKTIWGSHAKMLCGKSNSLTQFLIHLPLWPPPEHHIGLHGQAGPVQGKTIPNKKYCTAFPHDAMRMQVQKYIYTDWYCQSPRKNAEPVSCSESTSS